MAHGKSTVVKAVSGVQTVRFKNELERNITIKLGKFSFQRASQFGAIPVLRVSFNIQGTRMQKSINVIMKNARDRLAIFREDLPKMTVFHARVPAVTDVSYSSGTFHSSIARVMIFLWPLC